MEGPHCGVLVCFPTFVGVRMLSDTPKAVQIVTPHRDVERDREEKPVTHFSPGDVLHYAPGGMVPQALVPSSQETEVGRLLHDQAHLRLCKFNTNLGYHMTS